MVQQKEDGQHVT